MALGERLAIHTPRCHQRRCRRRFANASQAIVGAMGVVESEAHRAVFIVRMNWDPGGQVTGVLERVRTGERVRIDGLADMGRAVDKSFPGAPLTFR